MTAWEVNLVTAFGRGESLALALQNNAFSVRVLDFTSAFGAEYSRGPGPFPIALDGESNEQKAFLSEATKLPRGLAFWLPDGPIELNSPMTAYYSETRGDLKALHGRSPEFREDWLRRFLLQWASPFQQDSWAIDKGALFPFDSDLGLIPSYDETQVMSFERFQSQGHPVISCQTISDLQFEGSRLAEAVVEAGQSMAFGAEQWVWCLSSRETEILNSQIATRIFNKGVWRPEWSWVTFTANCDSGPWLDGLPGYMVVMGDLFLPWVYANALVVRRRQPEGFQVWMKVPAKLLGNMDLRRGWAADAEALLNGRLSMAKWTVDGADMAVCPHSPVFEPHQRDIGTPNWKNLTWIAPETLERLDLAARLEAESDCYERLEQWRNDQIKKQGAPRDRALHTP